LLLVESARRLVIARSLSPCEGMPRRNWVFIYGAFGKAAFDGSVRTTHSMLSPRDGAIILKHSSMILALLG
jgi:hypothetical protein